MQSPTRSLSQVVQVVQVFLFRLLVQSRFIAFQGSLFAATPTRIAQFHVIGMKKRALWESLVRFSKWPSGYRSHVSCVLGALNYSDVCRVQHEICSLDSEIVHLQSQTHTSKTFESRELWRKSMYHTPLELVNWKKTNNMRQCVNVKRSTLALRNAKPIGRA